MHKSHLLIRLCDLNFMVPALFYFGKSQTFMFPFVFKTAIMVSGAKPFCGTIFGSYDKN